MNPLDKNSEPEKVLDASTEVNQQLSSEEVKEVTTELVNEETAIEPNKEAEVQEEVTEISTVNNSVPAQLTKPEMVSRLKELIEEDVEKTKIEVDELKQQFYKKVKAEHEEQKKAFYEENDESDEFTPQTDELEEEFKTLLNEFRTKKAEYSSRLEQEKESNYLRKLAIIDELKAMIDSNDDVSSHINHFRELQKT